MIDFAYQIKQSVSMIQVCERYGIELDRAGFGHCPFHNERTGSFKAYPGAGGWACYGCHRQGSVIDFVMQYFQLSFKGALRKLNTDFFLNLPLDGDMPPKQRYAAEMQSRKRMMERRQYEKRLHAAQEAYNDALTNFCDLDRALIAEQEAAAQAREISPYMATLLKSRALLKYKLDTAENELIKIERERR